MLTDEIPLNETALKDCVGNGKIEFCLYNQRSKSSGMPTWELKVLNTDGTFKIVIVRD